MPKRLTSDQGGHYGNRPIKADEGTNGETCTFQPLLYTRFVLLRPELC